MISKKRFLPRMLRPFIYGVILNLMFCAHSDAFDNLMTDKAMLDLAYSERDFRNVGALHAIYTSPCCSSVRQKIASVVYIGGKTCITNAHCLEADFWDIEGYFLARHQVSFELSRGIHTFFGVMEHVVHSDYLKADYNDIAMICLDKTVDGLHGLIPDYSFGKNEPYVVDSTCNQLTCVGYGHSGDDDSVFITNDSFRRAFQTELFYIQKPENLKETIRLSMPNKSVCSLPYKCNVQLMGTKNFKTVSRERFTNESLMREGMSGGAMLYNGGFVGINASMFYGLTAPYDHAKQYILSYTNKCMNGFLWPFFRLRVFFPFEGSATYSVPLGMYEEWIEGYRAKFDGAAAPQSEVITAEERGFDIEGGNLETRHSKTL